MLKKILIANRGAIAVRIIRTLKKMGVASVAVYSEADADSLHVRDADEAYSLGEGAASNTYLNQDKLFEIIKKTGVDAIHPGYGFLSENAEFSRRCDREGIVFLGPTAQQMEVFGLKHTARHLADENNVPLLPGTELLADIDTAVSAAREIGYPLMLKSTAGGGGIGMQLCHSENELVDAFDSVRRLSGNNFSNDGVFLEKFIESARHIEVQVFGDGEGDAITLGERDCSSQRRNQKVLEETPAPNLSESTRKQLQEVAYRLLTAIDYRSAGTVEFIVDQATEKFYFLEVNTRLQVEHGVTEAIYEVDIVEWMVKLGGNTLAKLDEIRPRLTPKGHSIQVRLYAENPYKNFQPSAGLLSQVNFPDDTCLSESSSLRIDHWIEAGITVSPFFDPMLAKIIVTENSREQAIASLKKVLGLTEIYGIETNLDYLSRICAAKPFKEGSITTRYLNHFNYQPLSVDVLSAGTMTTIQDFPGRQHYWDIGVPPSGPFDSYAQRLANRLLGNASDAAVLEVTLNGPRLQFNTATEVVVTGAEFDLQLDGQPVVLWQPFKVLPEQVLTVGKVTDGGARCYLAVAGGWQCPDYLGSKSTFTLGQFGGHNGRALQVGDVLHVAAGKNTDINQNNCNNGEPLPMCPQALIPGYSGRWQINVIYGPHGAPEFFTPEDIKTFFDAEWEVHYNSSRTGIRLIGPKPEWARSDGGEAGMHPSNIHDNAYAVGAIDFTGDMPVILGPDGPSLGGFVCPATVITADLWKLGQLKAGDKIRFHPVSIDSAVTLEKSQQQTLSALAGEFIGLDTQLSTVLPSTPIVKQLSGTASGIDVVYRPAGDHYLLVEYGELVLDINLRFRVHALMLWLENNKPLGMQELTPGIRSLQIHYDSQRLSLDDLLTLLGTAEQALGDCQDLTVPTRTVHLPLSWDDEVCRQAIEKYDQSVRKDAPWAPSNLEFIRRINGLESLDDVKKIVFDASYLVMGLGDVYLGAPVATPLDPRHRLVTTKYNPARTWTAENSVGIGGSYLCIYGMEGPGGYQFVGRTLQMWNRYKATREFTKPWLLRFFDQIKFYEVSHEELLEIRRNFPKGNFSEEDSPIKVEESSFSLSEYNRFIQENNEGITTFTKHREKAFDEELQRWKDQGQFHFESESKPTSDEKNNLLADDEQAVDSHIAGNIWKSLVAVGDAIEVGQVLMIIESMKMEIEVTADFSGRVKEILVSDGDQVGAGQRLVVLSEK